MISSELNTLVLVLNQSTARFVLDPTIDSSLDSASVPWRTIGEFLASKPKTIGWTVFTQTKLFLIKVTSIFLY